MNLQEQIKQPLMHADVVPTLMAAADVSYDDQRKKITVDLLHDSIPPRDRIVQVTPGKTILWQTMLSEAQRKHLQMAEDVRLFRDIGNP